MGKGSKDKSKKLANSKKIIKNLVAELFQKCIAPVESSGSNPRELFNAYKEIHGLLQTIEKHRRPSVVSQLGSRSDYKTEFTNWSKKQNILFESVELRTIRGSEFGIFALKEINEGDIFIKVPRDAMLTSEMVGSSPLGPLIIEDPMLASMPNVALALLLLYELYNEKSKWQAYINILPRSYNNILYFEIDDVEMLKGTSIFPEALNILKSIARQYAYISNLLFKHPLGKQLGLVDKITYDDYKWAVATLMTRQNPLPSINGSKPALALIPLLDMCNHKEGPASIDYDPATDNCECFAPNSIQCGEEVFIHYGSRPNTELVIYNGFFNEQNSYDFIKLKLVISKTDEFADMRRELTAKLQLEEQLPLGCLPFPLKETLKAFLIIANASEEELHKLMQLDKLELAEKLQTENGIGKETKIRYLTFLKDRCSLLARLIQAKKEQNGEVSDGVIHQYWSTSKLSMLLKNNEKKIFNDAITYIENELRSLQE